MQAAESPALRFAEHEGGIVLDLGDPTGKAVVCAANGWRTVDRSPVLFRRTALTAPLPIPKRGGRVDELRAILNVSDDVWPLMRGWLLAAMLPSVPQPILLLGGRQGTGKGSAARLLVELIDASTAPLRSEPRDADAWALSAAASWAFAVDNVSHIPPWWSEALCRLVTGDGWLRRRLYTDGDVAVLSFRRKAILTSIDPGALRGDLGDRLLLAELEPIADDDRKTDEQVRAAAEALRPRVLGALLDLLATYLKHRNFIQYPPLPRMADFGKVLAFLDAMDGPDGRALALYAGQRNRIASEVVEADPIGLAVMELLTTGPWEGTASELLKAVSGCRPSEAGLPKNPRAMSAQLERLAPALKSLGYCVEHRRDNSPGRSRKIAIRPIV